MELEKIIDPAIEHTNFLCTSSKEFQDCLRDALGKLGRNENLQDFNLTEKLAIFYKIYETFGGIKGKKVIDIGCGAYHDAWGGEGWPPLNSRLLNYAGADVVGIDCAPSPGENYKHIQKNLLYNSIKDIVGETKKFDAAIVTNFLDSPNFIYKKGRGDSSHEKRIFQEVYSVLKDKGILLTEFIGERDLPKSCGFIPEDPRELKIGNSLGGVVTWFKDLSSYKH